MIWDVFTQSLRRVCAVVEFVPLRCLCDAGPRMPEKTSAIQPINSSLPLSDFRSALNSIDLLHEFFTSSLCISNIAPFRGLS